MPIEGRLYTAQELQELLGVTKQRISSLATQQGWTGPAPGLYWSEPVEDYLIGFRDIDPLDLPIRDYDHPDGATWAEREAEYEGALRRMESEPDE